MKSLFKEYSKYKWFVAIFSFAFVLMYVLDWINGKDHMSDFLVYYEATESFIAGDQVYGQRFGTTLQVYSGYYKYSPAVLPFFVPLVLLPYKVASSVFYFFICFCFFQLSFSLARLFSADSSKRKIYTTLFVTGLIVLDHVMRELHLGNVNLILLLLFTGVLRFQLKGNNAWSGLFLGLGLLMKPHFLILIPLFVVFKKWRTLGFMVLFSALIMTYPFAIVGMNNTVSLYGDWFIAMQKHNHILAESPNTIYGIIQHFILDHFWLWGGNGMVLFILTLSAFGILYLKKKGRGETDRVFALLFFLLIAMIPNLTHTDTEHFLWTMPLIAYVINDLLKGHKKWRWVLLGMAVIPYTLNTPDLFGSDLSIYMDEGGILGLANLVFIGLTIGVFLRKSKVTSSLVPS